MAHFATRAIHVGSEPDPSTGAVIPSLSVATTFKQDGVGLHRGFDYSRSGNPTRSALESLLTSLETGSKGESVVFASGSAATAALAHWATLSKSEGGGGGRDGNGGGGHILSVNDVYGGTARYFARTAKPTGLEVTFLDLEKAGEEGIKAAIREDTKIIWLEVPTNPLLLIPPLPLIAKIVNSLPNATRPLVVIDTTFLSPFNITPLIAANDGPPLADITLSSLSKYASGHSDIILGSVTIAEHTIQARPEIVKGLRFLQNSLGASPSPRDCHLLIRSLKTLDVRVLKHGLNALRLAAWLDEHPQVERVRYPGFKRDNAFHTVEGLLSKNARRELEYLGWTFPYHSTEGNDNHNTLAYTRSLGIPFGGVITFAIKDADAEATDRFITKLQIILLAESLGGVESLIEVPHGMTHSHLPPATLDALGITPNLVRLSVGIEDVDDLIHDLEEGFAAL